MYKFVKFVATQKGRYDIKFFSTLSFVAVFGSGMGKNQDPGYTSRISHTAMRIKKIIDGKSLHVQYGI